MLSDCCKKIDCYKREKLLKKAERARVDIQKTSVTPYGNKAKNLFCLSQAKNTL